METPAADAAPKLLSELSEKDLIAQAVAIENSVRQFDIDMARRAGFDLGQAAVLRKLAAERAPSP